MKRLLALLALALSSGLSLAGSVIPAGSTTTTLTVSWVAPTTNVDGSAISGAITYNAYWGTSCTAPLTLQMNATPVTGLSYLVTQVGPGLKCFAVTAVVNGVESAQSAMVPVTVTTAPVVPSPPTGVTVK